MQTTGGDVRTCGAQGVANWDATDRCGSRAALVALWRDHGGRGHAVSVCEDCADVIRCFDDDSKPVIAWTHLPRAI